MFYEEQMVNGIMCWRNTPTGEWTQFTIEELSQRYSLVKKSADMYRAEIRELRKKYD